MAKIIVQDEEGTYLVDLRAEESLRLGRSRDCDLALSAPKASRHHAEIVSTGKGHAIRDLGSTNGTLVNGAPFEGTRDLGDGDVLVLGGARLVYRSLP